MPRDGVGKMLVRRFETWETRTFRDYGMKDGNYPVPCISGTVFKKKNKIWKMEIWEEAPDLEERIPASNFEEIE